MVKRGEEYDGTRCLGGYASTASNRRFSSSGHSDVAGHFQLAAAALATHMRQKENGYREKVVTPRRAGGQCGVLSHFHGRCARARGEIFSRGLRCLVGLQLLILET